jgi:hypothetical protein
VKTVSTSGLCGNGACSSTNEKPFGSAPDAAPGGASLRDAGVVAFVRERGGFFALVGEVALCGGELCLAGFAVDGEIVERL